ncbi:hypothetical protein Bbelb_346780 [Branchiostoma belcheri]|nr:hypothetical protein Bbelb_346780 [Branchiostoma belcheri]
MMITVLVLSLVGATLALPPRDGGNHWAVVVAGSNGWGNYRHQADACHAYQILHRNGIPDDRIIVMMYDDIANNEENPTPGIIINRPNGTDVYKGVPKDYNKEDVTPDNFLNVLKGNKEAMAGIGSGKVLQSGPEDNVFVFFTDHGAPNLIAFPESELHAKDMMEALQYMHDNNMYKNLVFYLEACESGSMFHRHLPDNINIFATSAANPHESSYACYFDEKRETYLGDLYSVKWMEDSDTEDLRKETLQRQFKIVRRETNTSHVREYGDMSMKNMTLLQFQGGKVDVPLTHLPPYPEVPLDAVPAPDVKLAVLQHRLKAARTEEERSEITDQIKQEFADRKMIQTTVDTIVRKVAVDSDQADQVLKDRTRDLTAHDCYKRAVTHFCRRCFLFNVYEHALRHLYTLVNLCEEGLPVDRITGVMDQVCIARN